MSDTPRHSKRLKTSKEKESQDIAEDVDLEALQELKKSLFCSVCQKFPRPNVYTCHICDVTILFAPIVGMTLKVGLI